MKRAAMFVLAILFAAACEVTTQPEVTAPIQAPQFARINVPGDYSSIQDAHDAASSGDTILLQPGVYVEQITISKAITLGSLYVTTGDESYIGTDPIRRRRAGHYPGCHHPEQRRRHHAAGEVQLAELPDHGHQRRRGLRKRQRWPGPVLHVRAQQ
jgi:hypothetical protein